MSLTILRSKRPVRNFTIYDLEWVPGTLQVRMVGVYDEKGYRWYETVDQFLAHELSRENRGRWFYAHAGGLADIQFVFDRVLQNRFYQVDGKFSGSSCIIAKVKRGKNNWTFIDSYWLLRESLAVIGEWVGIGKGQEQKWRGKAFEDLSDEERKDFYTNASIGELKRYNETDCVILYTAIMEMQHALLSMGGQLQMTQAASAMNLFRREYLSRDIQTNPMVNELILESYFASRVEVFSSKCYDANYYDINSSFPYAMTMPCPGEFLGSHRKLPDDGIYFADVTFSIADTYLPPVPTRINGRLFFPTGEWRSWLSGIDVELLQRAGGKIRKLHQSFHFAPFEDLAAYATTLYNKRRASPEGFLKVAYKLLLNSLYGKFAESPHKQSLLIDPAPDRVKYCTCNCLPCECGADQMLMPGVWLIERKVPVPHMHVPISSHITAIARRTLFDYLSNCGEFHYCDTDGFSTTETLGTSSTLGALKLEKLIREGTFLASKLYRLQGTVLEDGEWKDLETGTKHQGVKAKGFSRPSVERFLALQEGREVEAIRMARVKEVMRRAMRDMRDGDSNPRTHPSESSIKKKLNLTDSIPKRFTYPDGETRPWHITELEPLR